MQRLTLLLTLVIVASLSLSSAAMSLTTLITGANKGIGLAIVKQLSLSGHRIYAACRSSSSDLDAVNLNGGCVITGVDVGNSIDALQNIPSDTKIDWLINNAGILTMEGLDSSFDLDAIRQQFEVNTLGPLKVTKKMLPMLKEGSKVFIITSRMGSVEDNTSGGLYGYRVSKCAVNMVGKNLSIDLKKQGIIVNLLHPGMVTTDMTAAFGGGIPTSESASGLIKRMNEASIENTGKFYHMNGGILPW